MPLILFSYYKPISDSIPAIVKQEHDLGRRLLIQGLSRFYGKSFTREELEQLLREEENGKPFLKGFPQIHFNITHCTGFAACAFHDQPVGIDAELPGYFAPVLKGAVLSPEEQAALLRTGENQKLLEECFYRYWTLKEAYVKMTGTGVSVPLKDISFSFSPPPADPAPENDVPGEISITCTDRTVFCFQQKLAVGHILSLITRSGGKTPEVSLIPAADLPDRP